MLIHDIFSLLALAFIKPCLAGLLKLFIILCALIGAAIAGVLVFKFIKPVYQATAKIYIVGSDTTIS